MRNKIRSIKLIITLLCIFLSNETQAENIIKFGTLSAPDTPIFIKVQAILTEAFKRNGYEFSLVSLPGLRSLLDADNGILDGDAYRIFSLNSENQYNNLIRIEEPVYIIDQSVWSNKDIEINGWESLRDYRLIYQSGSKIIENNLNFFQESYAVNSLKQAFLMITLDRGDITITSRETGYNTLRENSLENSEIRILSPPLLEIKLYPYLNRKHEELAKKIARTLIEMKADGTFQKLME